MDTVSRCAGRAVAMALHIRSLTTRCPCVGSFARRNDYYGEQSSWPHVSANYGQIDLCGFPKPAAKWYRENWLRHPNATDGDKVHAQIQKELDAAAQKHSRVSAESKLSLALSIDVPSASTCTGEKVVLDGNDVALVRITVVDAAGTPVLSKAADVNVSVAVSSGPGRVIGVGNGDTSSHQRPKGHVIQTNAGLARAVVQVSQHLNRHSFAD